MYDALLQLQSLTTQTASTNSAGRNLVSGTPKRGLVARVNVTTVSGTAPSLTPRIQHSDDNTTYTDLAVGSALTSAGTVDIPFITNKKYVRLATTISGTSPSFVFTCDVGDATWRSE